MFQNRRRIAKVFLKLALIFITLGVGAYVYRILFAEFPAYSRSVAPDGTPHFREQLETGGYRDAIYEIVRHGGLWIECAVASGGSIYAFTPTGRVFELEGLDDGYYVVDSYRHAGSFRDFTYPRSTKWRPRNLQ